VFTGAGTCGAYQAGVTRAFQEAGVKVDLVAGHGMGTIVAMFAATDGGARLWEADGLWRHRHVARFYGWRPRVRWIALATAAALSVVLIPFAVLGLGLLSYPVAFLLGVAGVDYGQSIVTTYSRAITTVFAPAFLPTVLPRALVLSLTALIGVMALVLLVLLVNGRQERTNRMPLWWRILGWPLDAGRVVDHFERGLWRLIGGAAHTRLPSDPEFCRGYAELLSENIGQPGFRELVVAAHDLDTRRDLVFAMLSDRHRRDFFQRRGGGGERRAAETMDLAGVGRHHVLDALRGALVLPVATEPHMMQFEPESYWRGESHRVVDRPGAIARLLAEVEAAGAEQVIVVSAFAEGGGPHALSALRGGGRRRLGEYLAAVEVAALRDAIGTWRGRFKALFEIRPVHNPLGPLDFRGRFDEQSDRWFGLGELVDRGYEDAYRQFIDPVVAASGDGLGAARGGGVRKRTRDAG
jgi:hypothetical protein